MTTSEDQKRKRQSQSGGVVLAFAILAGVIGGGLAGQPSIGFLAGTGIGILLLILIWLRDRGRG